MHASDKIEADKDRVALRYGPLVYNIEKVDQDIDGVLDPSAPLSTEWRGDLLGGGTGELIRLTGDEIFKCERVIDPMGVVAHAWGARN